MSRAFVKESESEWLGDVEPEATALGHYLTRENGGVKVYELRTEFNEEEGREIHVMSNGSCYALDEDRRWYAV
jgi:hypothetical protein